MKTNVPLVNFRRMQVPTPWWLVLLAVTPVLAWRLGKVLVRLTVFLVRHLRAVALVLTVAWVWHRFGWPTLAITAAVLAAGGALWWWRHRPTCERWLLWPLLSQWRRLWVYHRQWDEAMTLCGLVKTYDGGRKVPTLCRVRSNYAADEVVLRMPRGHSPELYHKAAQNLAYSFSTRHCRVFSTRRDPKPTRTGRLAWCCPAFRMPMKAALGMPTWWGRNAPPVVFRRGVGRCGVAVCGRGVGG